MLSLTNAVKVYDTRRI